MRIAHVIDSLEVGGAEAVVASLCRVQARAGHSLEVHCLDTGGALAERLTAEGIPVRVHGPARSWTVGWRLFRAFRQSRPEVVHCHNKTATVHAAPIARITGAQAVLSTRHGLAPPPYRFRKEFKFWVLALLSCDHVVAVCEAARQNMAKGARVAAHKLVTIRNGAYAAPSSRDLPEPDPKAKDGFTLINVGRLTVAKDQATLLRAVARARCHVSDLRLCIVGDGEDARALKQLASELGIESAVQFPGERHDVGDWLRRADVFVLSSVSEGLPISILEAMAAGLPAIVTQVGGMPEIVQLSGAGMTVPPRDVDALAAAIVDLADRREQLPEMGRRALCCYRQHFTPERMAEDYLAVYRRCLRREPRFTSPL